MTEFFGGRAAELEALKATESLVADDVNQYRGCIEVNAKLKTSLQVLDVGQPTENLGIQTVSHLHPISVCFELL